MLQNIGKNHIGFNYQQKLTKISVLNHRKSNSNEKKENLKLIINIIKNISIKVTKCNQMRDTIILIKNCLSKSLQVKIPGIISEEGSSLKS